MGLDWRMEENELLPRDDYLSEGNNDDYWDFGSWGGLWWYKYTCVWSPIRDDELHTHSATQLNTFLFSPFLVILHWEIGVF
jgi:hypothetical protein